MKNTTGSAQRVIGVTLGLIKYNKWNELINLQVLQYVMWYKKGKSINHCQTEVPPHCVLNVESFRPKT